MNQTASVNQLKSAFLDGYAAMRAQTNLGDFGEEAWERFGRASTRYERDELRKDVRILAGTKPANRDKRRRAKP